MVKVRVIIIDSLKNQILKKFKKESGIIFRKMKSLGENTNKGKVLGNVGGIIIKELKYKSFRFYFITDGYKLKIMDKLSVGDLLVKFFRMSNKKEQQKIIDEIKNILRKVGKDGF